MMKSAFLYGASLRGRVLVSGIVMGGLLMTVAAGCGGSEAGPVLQPGVSSKTKLAGGGDDAAASKDPKAAKAAEADQTIKGRRRKSAD